MTQAGFKLRLHGMDQGSIVSFWINTHYLNMYLGQIIWKPVRIDFPKDTGGAFGLSEELHYLICPFQS